MRAIFGIALFAALALFACARAATTVTLTTPAGVCHFEAASFTSTPPGAVGTFGVGCPGYVPPDQPPVNPPTACGAVPPGRISSIREKFIPSNLTRTIDATNYDALFGTVPGTGGAPGYAPPREWPGYGGNVTVLTFPGATNYAAFKFHTPALLTKTKAGAWAYAGTGSTTTGTMSVSQCPGVFDATAQGWCYGSGGEGHGVSYGNTAANARFTCGLKPDTDYFLNLRPAPGQPCGGGTCGLSILHSIYAN